MATFETTIHAAQKETRGNVSRLTAPNQSGGELHVAVIPYTLAGTEAATDIINLCHLPVGAIPIPQLSHVTASADPSSGTLTLHVGTEEDVDGWANTVLLGGGGQQACTSGTMPAWILPTKLAADAVPTGGGVRVFATVAAASASPDAGDILYFTLAYKLPA